MRIRSSRMALKCAAAVKSSITARAPRALARHEAKSGNRTPTPRKASVARMKTASGIMDPVSSGAIHGG